MFDFDFVGVGAADISVLYTDVSGNITTLAPALYALTLDPVSPGQIWAIGGTVQYPLMGSPIAVGTFLTILRTLPLTQPVSLSNQGSLFPQSVETALDLMEMQVQQVSEAQGRAITVAVSDPAPLSLPPVAQRANLGMAFDGSGNPIAAAIPATGVISSAMQPVVNAASTGLARTALGLGAMAEEGIGAGIQDDGSGNARVNFPTVADAASKSVDKTFHLTQRIATGPITYALPASSSLWNGFGFWINAVAGTITLTVNGTDFFQGQSSGASFFLPPGQTAYVTTNALGVWYASLTSAVPTGAVVNFIATIAPAGYLPLSGQLVSRTTYANLWAFVQASAPLVADVTWTGSAPLYDGSFSTGDGSTTFRLPDARGNFQRGWDNGRGVDPGRAIGTVQLDAFQDHTHSGIPTNFSVVSPSGSSSFATAANGTSGLSNSGRSATETRPRNVAWLTCIKY